ncbi:MAG: S-layer homology domain-containing protein [Clostridia bacterium]|nr:S-layer homology domain-containing protein [Clostridia bacterium]
MRKRLFSAVLTVCMVAALFPSAAFAADIQKTQQVTIAGKTLTSGMGWNNDGTTTSTGSSGNNAYFKDGVLYLNDADISTQGTAISASNGNLTIQLSGDSYIDASATAANNMVQAVVFNADDNESTAGNIVIQGEGMLEIESGYAGIVNEGSSTLEVKDAAISISSEDCGIATSGDLSVTGSAMLVAEAKHKCISAKKLTVAEYASVYAESEQGEDGSAISCTGLESKGYLAAYGDADAINCTGNVAITGGSLEARVRRNTEVPALHVYSGGTVSTNGMYVHAGISSLDAQQVTDFDSSFENYRYVIVAEDSSWLNWENGFEDVASNMWYYTYVSYVNQHNLMAGVGNAKFAPNDTTTRSQAVQILYNLSMNYWEQYGVDSGSPVSFTDVPSNMWFAKAVNWAGANNIVSGVGNNRFAPDDNVTRQEFAQILYAFAKQLGYDVSASADLSRFGDSQKVAGWSQTAMKWAVGAGIMSGTNKGLLNPDGALTRAEAATMIKGFIQTTLNSGR